MTKTAEFIGVQRSGGRCKPQVCWIQGTSLPSRLPEDFSKKVLGASRIAA